MRETTWEPQGHLLDHGSEEIVQKYLQKNKDKDDLKIVAYMIREVEHKPEGGVHLFSRVRGRKAPLTWPYLCN